MGLSSIRAGHGDQSEDHFDAMFTSTFAALTVLETHCEGVDERDSS